MNIDTRFGAHRDENTRQIRADHLTSPRWRNPGVVRVRWNHPGVSFYSGGLHAEHGGPQNSKYTSKRGSDRLVSYCAQIRR